jgi:hypothetical protein
MVRATVSNIGSGDAAATSTEFRFDDGTLLGSADTPAIAAGSSATVEVGWDTRGQNGEHVIEASADASTAVAEASEGNNRGRLSLTVRGNKVENGSFEQPADEGEGPAAWQGSSTAAGSTGWSETGSDGARAVTITGTGKSVVLHGLPAWSSAPIAVSPGQRLSLSLDVASQGLSSAPSVGVAWLDATGGLLSSVTALTAPLKSSGFVTLEKALSVPAGVSGLRIVLYGFSATDLATRGTVTFDNVGLYEE